MMSENTQEYASWQPDVPDLPGAAYFAARGFEGELAEELARNGKHIIFQRDRLFGTREVPFNAVWAQNIWLNPRFIPIASIANGAAQLKAMQRNWALYSTVEHRRAALIADSLPVFRAKPHVFGSPLPTAPLGSWTLWSHEMLLASPLCSSPFPHGEAVFEENRRQPPNRAYLKLWETFTRIDRFPGPGDVCLDLGSAPGGWTWVLASLGARVFSVDKAELAPLIAAHPYVDYCRGSAFAFNPHLAGDVSWLFCDVACYPERLYKMVQKWIEADVRANMVCTIKFTGKTDFTALDAFMRISEALTMHLFANKHEVTWIRLVK